MSRIEQLISDIEAYIDNCKYQPFSNNKIIVDKDQLEDMLSELRLKTPDEIKKYQKILNNKDAIISDAKEQAESILNAAQIQTEELINEHEIMQRAYALKLNVYSRADFLLDAKGNLFCLEMNTLPGMTSASLLPKEAKVYGIEYGDLCELIIKKSMEARY